MTSWPLKSSVLQKRIRRLEREIHSVDSEIASLTQTVRKSGRSLDVARLDALEKTSRPVPVRRGAQDDRLADFLANSFEAARPLRHERRIQRNKAIVMLGVVLILVAWLVLRFVL